MRMHAFMSHCRRIQLCYRAQALRKLREFTK